MAEDIRVKFKVYLVGGPQAAQAIELMCPKCKRELKDGKSRAVLGYCRHCDIIYVNRIAVKNMED